MRWRKRPSMPPDAPTRIRDGPGMSRSTSSCPITATRRGSPSRSPRSPGRAGPGHADRYRRRRLARPVTSRQCTPLAAAQDLPVVLERNPANRGRPYTRNRLLDGIDSDYVAWLDAGDVWYPAQARGAVRAPQPAALRRARTSAASGSPATTTGNGTAGAPAACSRRSTAAAARADAGAAAARLSLDAPGHGGERSAPWAGSTSACRGCRTSTISSASLQAGGRLAVPPDQRALCRYHKSDLGRDAAEIRRCNRLIFEKHRPGCRPTGRPSSRRSSYNSERLSARYAEQQRRRG